MKQVLMNRKIIILLFGLFICLSGYSQPVAQQEVPTLPEAASLLKFVEAPVNNFTGIPNIGIPLYTAQEGNLSVPISINYHASGIKVNEVASEVGIGWALNAGGVISRQVNGGPDEQPSLGYLAVSPFTLNSQSVDSVWFGGIDIEPDVFTFNIPGYSGKFMFNELHEIEIMPRQPLKIEVNSLTSFTLFTITTPEGNKYFFGLDNYEGVLYDGIDESGANNGGVCDYNTTAWHLIRIESHDGADVITIDYEKADYNYKMPARKEFYSADNLPPSYPSNVPNLLCAKESKIKTIKTSTQEISFDRLIDREDLGIGAGIYRPKQLNEIKLTSGSFQNKWVLSYDYFEDSDNTNNDEEGKRLRLVSLQKQAINGGLEVDPNPYLFDYLKKNGNYFLPHRLDKAIDFWGYYNGEIQNNYTNNYMNIPDVSVNNRSCPGCNGDRTTSPTEMKYGVLNKITHPTDGATFFEYEANRYKPTALNDQMPGGTEVNTLSLPTLKSCAGPGSIHYNLCCNTKTKQQARNFTPSQLEEGMFFVMKVEKPLDPIDDDGCMNPVNISYNLKIWEASDPVNILYDYSFNILQEYVNAVNAYQADPVGSPSSFVLEQTKILNQIQPALQPNVDYIFEIETEEIYGEVKFFEKTYVPDTPEGEIYVGGLRVKQVRVSESNASTPASSDIVKRYEYSDGTLFNPYPKVATPIYGVAFANQNNSQTFNGAIFVEEPLIPFSNMNGYHIGYEEITEVHDGGNGKKIMRYNVEPVPPHNTSPGAGSSTVEEFPGQIPLTLLADNGKNVGTEIYADGETSPIVENSTLIKPENYKYIEGNYYRVRRININGLTGLFTYKFNYRTKYHRLTSTTSILDGVETTTEFFYDVDDNSMDRHPFPVRVTMTNSDGTTHTTENEYAFDMTGTVYDAMVDRNIIATPIKVTQKVGNNIVDATQTIYDFFQSNGAPGGSGSDPIYPKEYQRLEKTWDANGTLISDNWQTLGTVLSYDPQTGKPASFQQPGWEVENYTWDATNKQIETRTFKDFSWTYNYYPGTNLLSEIIDIDGQDTDFTYDPLMRLKTVNARDGNVITTYDYHFTTGGTDKNYVKTRTDFTPVGDSELHFQESWQYMDGLGRPLQTVQRGYAPNGSDLVTGAVEYDNQGRVVTSYEPFEGGTSGAFTAPSGPATTTEYYDSPLNRIEKVTPPNWYATTYTYGNNANAIPVGGKTYSSGELIAQTVTDPDGIATTTYTDKKGRVILTEVKEGSDISKTYTIHDDKDRVKTVLPPGVTNVSSPLAFQYEYDGADNIIRKYIPDMGWMSYLYDERDLLTASQDPKLLSEGKWLTSTYDAYGRVVETGFYNENTSSLLNGNNSVVQQVLSTTLYDGVCGQSDPIYQGKACQTRTRVLGTNDWLETNFEYDAHGRTIKTVGNNHVNLSIGSEEVNLTYDWADNLISSNRIHQAFGQQVVINERMTYDHSGRLEDTYHRVGTGAEQLISRQEYSSKDELQIKHLGGFGNSFLQKVDYSYLDNGFLKGINETMESNDLFQLNLQYDAVITGVNAVPRKNGNISQLIWQTKGDTTQSYGFQYDFLNRLEVATYGDYSTGSLNGNNHYTSSYQYDARGNITTLDRFGAVEGLGHPAIDNLVYAYDTGNSNRLQSIIDNAGTTARDQGFKPGVGGNYQYDENGNMNYDPHKGINIQYNHLNLPEFIEFSDCEIIDNTYDASGSKLRKIIKSSTAIISTQDYLGGIEYRNGVLEAIYHSEGRLYYDNDTTRYEYTLSDHLGNNRLTFTDFNADGVIDPDEVMEKTHYYPFGMRMEGNGLINRGRENKYLYNGKELNEEFGLNWSSYGAREYDASIGQWMSIDPLAEAMAGWSPYNYTFRNPISYGDPTGLAPEKNCPDCPVYEHPGVTITGSTPGRNYDQTVDRYGFNGTFAQWQSTYGYEGWSYENASAYYNSNIAPSFDKYVHAQDSIASAKDAVDRMGAFALWYGLIGESGFANPAAGTTNGVQYLGASAKSFKFSSPIRSLPTIKGIHSIKTSSLNLSHGRTMSNNQFKKLLKDIKQSGIKDPVIYTEINGVRTVLDGNHRLLAARRLGIGQISARRVNLPWGQYRTVNDLIHIP